MAKYRVCYRRGSFALADDCENYGEALARALYLREQRGVWTVRLEDTAGALVCRDVDLEASQLAFTRADFDSGFAGLGAECLLLDRAAIGLETNSIQ